MVLDSLWFINIDIQIEFVGVSSWIFGTDYENEFNDRRQKALRHDLQKWRHAVRIDFSQTLLRRSRAH